MYFSFSLLFLFPEYANRNAIDVCQRYGCSNLDIISGNGEYAGVYDCRDVLVTNELLLTVSHLLEAISVSLVFILGSQLFYLLFI